MTEQDRIVVLEDNHRLRAENDILRAKANVADAAKELAAMADRELASDARKAHADVTEACKALSEVNDAVKELQAIIEEQKAEIKRLREIKEGFEGCCPACELVGEMNKTLRAERDEARRRVCEMSLELGKVYRRVGGKTVEVTTAEGVADMMQWDCYNHEYRRRQKALDEIARISEQLGLDLPPKQKDFLQDLG